MLILYGSLVSSRLLIIYLQVPCNVPVTFSLLACHRHCRHSLLDAKINSVYRYVTIRSYWTQFIALSKTWLLVRMSLSSSCPICRVSSSRHLRRHWLRLPCIRRCLHVDSYCSFVGVCSSWHVFVWFVSSICLQAVFSCAMLLQNVVLLM